MAGDGLPIKQIVRVTGLNRNLVRQILRGEREDAFRLPASREPQADLVLRRGVVIGALAAARLEGEFERAAVAAEPAAHQAPAEAVVAPGVRQADADLRRPGETVAEGRQAVAELQLQPPALQLVIAARAVVVRRQPFQRGAREQRIGAARGRPAERLGQPQLRPPVRARLAFPGERAREAEVAEALRLMGEQPAPAQLGLEAALRVAQREPAA